MFGHRWWCSHIIGTFLSYNIIKGFRGLSRLDTEFKIVKDDIQGESQCKQDETIYVSVKKDKERNIRCST